VFHHHLQKFEIFCESINNYDYFFTVLPRPISGNPNSVVAAIAMRAASWILKSELQAGDLK